MKVNLDIPQIVLVLIVVGIGSTVAGYSNPYPSRCSTKLEAALENMLRKGQSRSGVQSHLDLTPSYSKGSTTFSGRPSNVNEKMDYNDEDSGERSQPQRSVEVAELRVRLPQNSRWVHVDKCQFIPSNRTLDTRLVFPDLTISGRVVIHPSQGQCDMILRLRRAGIEFRTVPIMEGRSRAATVRTDSHFTEPGFISVYAHGCDGHRKNRPNSKRRYFPDPDKVGPSSERRYDRFYETNRDYDRPARPNRRLYDTESMEDDIRFDDENFGYITSRDEPSNDLNERTLYEYLSNYNVFKKRPTRPYSSEWQNVELANSAEVNEAFSRELETLFSQGVRSLLTTYMQKALQPAIKETLMESMGYTLSYG